MLKIYFRKLAQEAAKVNYLWPNGSKSSPNGYKYPNLAALCKINNIVLPVLAFRAAGLRVEKLSGHAVTTATAATKNVIVPDSGSGG